VAESDCFAIKSAKADFNLLVKWLVGFAENERLF
jgi:hypothetical protein|tara:strand:+ start:5738 stop:5839 length:102 start_codon:yes stop_codon:yes gene_type:complete